eukprot:5740923-Prymnesium_polylepis.1
MTYLKATCANSNVTVIEQRSAKCSAGTAKEEKRQVVTMNRGMPMLSNQYLSIAVRRGMEGFQVCVCRSRLQTVVVGMSHRVRVLGSDRTGPCDLRASECSSEDRHTCSPILPRTFRSRKS